ncbi:glucose-6-phosphate dehydrogenase [Sphingomonas segetis]|jgi:glucose-6-phosphate 1-dehydrogenase|uniref:glucose-6-phosphate dehydrogenase n=1 Tax=Sphingomonas segetis TaxID=1104779 RepID=UPI0012D3555D|nr:glucose-6-phosphate dehydrogenase [Sphingomonas segetis]
MVEKASTLLMFGATGDLARRMLLPSLYGLDSDGLLPADLRIIGTARTELGDEAFRERADAALKEHLPQGFYSEGIAKRFLGRLHYVPLDIKDQSGFDRLAKRIGDPCHGVAIFLSTAPSLFKPTIDGLAGAGLACPTVRMALEKPLGSDLESSREINDSVAGAFPEDRTFRIDHYLGKETVQNLLALRFANSMFEPLWNATHIDHVQITVAETIGLEGRGDYYDQAGALRDMVQNHMLQLLALVAMEPPADFNSTAVRDEKVKVLHALRAITSADVEANSVTGQYLRGAIDGEPVPGYAEEVGHESTTETFVALKAHIDNWRWKGVPFYLRTGKRMPMRDTEIFIQFRDVPYSIFASRGATTKPNKLIIGVQPEETISLHLMAKTPGLDRQGVRLREIPLDIGLANAFSEYRRRIAYERLLLDLIEGDPTLFVRRDEVEAQWGWIDRIRAAWTEKGLTPRPYAAGTWGPSAAIALTERDGISWHE